jgi:hypothetical protein
VLVTRNPHAALGFLLAMMLEWDSYEAQRANLKPFIIQANYFAAMRHLGLLMRDIDRTVCSVGLGQ